MAIWRIEILDRFHFSARIHAPPGTPHAAALRTALDALVEGPRPQDRPYLIAPCVEARCRRVRGTDLIIVYVVRAHTILVHAAVPDIDPRAK